jgi:hypothetical protein
VGEREKKKKNQPCNVREELSSAKFINKILLEDIVTTRANRDVTGEARIIKKSDQAPTWIEEPKGEMKIDLNTSNSTLKQIPVIINQRKWIRDIDKADVTNKLSNNIN